MDPKGQTRITGRHKKVAPATSEQGRVPIRNLSPVPRAGWGLLIRDTGVALQSL